MELYIANKLVYPKILDLICSIHAYTSARLTRFIKTASDESYPVIFVNGINTEAITRAD